MKSETVVHTLEPFVPDKPKILILGTIPSPKSRAFGFYYGHPQNRFWKVLAALFEETLPENNTEKKALLTRHHIALWDVLASCDIEGASDASIKNPEPNDLSLLLGEGKITKVYTTGTKAAAFYKKYSQLRTGIPAVALPSTSPANARMSLADLVEAYKVILASLSEKA